MENIKKNIKDSVFTKMFEDKKYLIQLYESLHPEDKITENELKIVSLESVLTNDAYNDLGFLVKDRLVILVEAQTTWSENIIVRMFIYLAKTYQEYIYSSKVLTAKLYSEAKIKLPTPELYVIYTGKCEGKPSVLSLRDKFFETSSNFIDLKANIIFADENRKDIIGQYIAFCVILKQQLKLYNGNKRMAIQETIRICIEEGNLGEYLSNHQKEVEDYMFALLSQEEMYTAVADNTALKALEDFIGTVKKFMPSFKEVYDECMSKESFSGFSKETIMEIYNQK